MTRTAALEVLSCTRALLLAAQHLPLVVDAEAFRPAGPKGSSARLHLPKHYPAGGLSRRDVHSDMGLVVIALDWPR